MYFCWGVSASMIFSLLPIFITKELGGSTISFGLLEGGVLFISFLGKILVSALIDIFKKQKRLLAIGSILTILSRISFLFAFNIFSVFIAKSCDRFARGIRSATSDVMFSKMKIAYGSSYTFKYMYNIAGYLAGSCLTSVIVLTYGRDFRLIFGAAVIPSLIAYIILRTKVKIKETEVKRKNTHKINLQSLKQFNRDYWQVITLTSILMFSRFSEGFITLKAAELYPNHLHIYPMFMIIYELCIISMALIISKIADNFNKHKILLIGISILVITNIHAIFTGTIFGVILVYAGAGIHMGITQGVLYSLVASTAPTDLKGSGFAIFYAVEGLTLLASNYLAGSSFSFASLISLPESSGPFILGLVASSSAAIYIIKSMNAKQKIAKVS